MVGVVPGKNLSLDLEPRQENVFTKQPQESFNLEQSQIYYPLADVREAYDDVKSIVSLSAQMMRDIADINTRVALGLSSEISYAINMILPDNISYPEMLGAVQYIIEAIAVYQNYNFSTESTSTNQGLRLSSRQDYSHIAVLSLDQQMQLAVNLVISKAIAKDRGRSWGSLEELLAILSDPEIEAELQLIIQQASDVQAPNYELMIEAIKLKLAQDKMRASLNIGLSAAMDANKEDTPQMEAPMLMGGTFKGKGNKPEEEGSN